LSLRKSEVQVPSPVYKDKSLGIVEPKILRGFRDLLPTDMIALEKIISVIKDVCESYGFIPTSTPAIEYKNILLAYGEETSKEVYFFEEPDGNMVGLRYDLTVPLSRVIAQYKNLPKPFKRYQVSTVWRYDKPNPGRFREFIQFDIDAVGTSSISADSEIILAIYDCLERLGPSFIIRLNNRKILNSLIVFAGIEPNMARSVFRVIDKLEKQGIEVVKQELGPGRVDISGDKIKGLGLNEVQIKKIEEFLSLPKNTCSEAIDSLKELFKSVKGAEEGIDEIKEIHDHLDCLSIPDGKIIIDFSIARGLDYYTGPVFEVVLTDAKEYGSVVGGGRFDELIGYFTGENTPATGASVGIDRLLEALKKLKLVKTKPSTADVIITIMVKDKLGEYQKIAKKIRDAGIKTELYVGEKTSIKEQLKYADKQDIPVAVIVGEDEFTRNEASIKDLRVIKKQKIEIGEREAYLKERIGQKKVPMGNLVEEIKLMLKK